MPADGMITAAEKGASARPVGNSIIMLPQSCVDVEGGNASNLGRRRRCQLRSYRLLFGSRPITLNKY
jgi:hypothetical protein